MKRFCVMGKNNLWETPRVDAYCYEYGNKKNLVKTFQELVDKV